MPEASTAASPAAGQGFFAPIIEWSVALMEQIGPVGAAVAVFLDNIFPPIPSEVVLPLAGMAASNGAFTLWEALAWATAGSLVSALIWYYVAVALGSHRLRRFVDRLPLMSGEDVDRSNAWFARHGVKAVFFGRMVPGVRSLVSLPAGFSRMSLLWFAVFTSAGSLLWNAIFIVAGYFLGEAWVAIQPYSSVFEIVALSLLVLAFLVFAVRRVRAQSRQRRAAPADGAAAPLELRDDIEGADA